MDSHDWDHIIIGAVLMAIAVSGILQLRAIRATALRVAAMEADVEFLKIVARETEASRGD